MTKVDASAALPSVTVACATTAYRLSGTVSGNISAAEATRNTLDLLALAGRDDIPVAQGAHDHLDHPYGGGAQWVHGENGIGGVELPRNPLAADSRTAVELLIDLSHAYAGRLHVLTIGPMTNLAHALDADPTLPERVAAGESEHGINSLGRKGARAIVDVDHPLAVDDRVSTHLSHQFDALYSGSRSKYASATQLGKLNGQRADAARGAMNDDCLTRP
jgi:hypothetical protein